MQFTPPSYVPPGKSVQEYLVSLRAHNNEIHARLTRTLTDLFSSQPLDASIAVLGSDGRREKSPASPIELCLYHCGTDPEPAITLLSQFTRKSGNGIFLPELDIKDVMRPGLNYYQDDSARVFPTRVTDSTVVYGPDCHLAVAKRSLVDEWAGTDGRHILDRVSNKTRESRKICEKNGDGMYKGNPVKHFDLDSGTATYDPARFHLSFKAGPLRLVQYAISRGLIKYARKGLDEASRAKEAVARMPTNTAERLGFLSDMNLFTFSQSNASTLGQHYDFFNTLYHTSENEFLCGNTTIQLPRGSNVKEHMRELVTLVEMLD